MITVLIVVEAAIAVTQFLLLTIALCGLSDERLGKRSAVLVIMNSMFMIPSVSTIVRWLSA